MAIIKKGTYRWNDILTLPSFAVDTDTEYVFSFLANGTSNVQGQQISAEFDSIKFSYSYYGQESDTTYKWMVWCRITSIDPEISNGPTLGAYQPWYRFDNNTYYTQLFGDGMQVSVVDEDFETDDEFASWFEANSQLIEEKPTVDSLKAKLQALINKANEATGRDDVNLDNAVSNLVAGYGTGGGGDIIEVTELPTENINEDALYKLIRSNVCVDARIGEIASARKYFEDEGIIFDIFNVNELPIENILESNDTQVYLYYIANEKTIYIYMDGSWITETEFIPIFGIDSYYKYAEEFKDLLLVCDGEPLSYIELMISFGMLIKCYYVKTRPTDNILVSTDNILYLYYVEDEDDVLAYGDFEGSGEYAWSSMASEESAFPWGGAITNISEAVIDNYLYALVDNGWKEYLAPEGKITIVANGTFDVTDKAEVTVNVETVLQEKTVTKNGEVTADEGYDGLSKVTVNVPQPNGELNITENGTYDVRDKASVIVDVESESTGGGAILQANNIGVTYGFKVDVGDIALPYVTPQINNIQITEA